MKVKFQTDYRDLAEAVWLASGAKSSYRNMVFNFLGLYAVVAGLAGIPLVLFAPGIIFPILEFVIIFLICFYFFRPPSFNHFTKHFLSAYGNEPFDYEIELSDDHLKISDGMSKSLISWKRVKEISETDENIFLIFKQKNGLKIPKSAFIGSAQIGEFIAFAISRASVSDVSLNDRDNQQPAQN